jgi:CheY-like chemotaxis protein
MPATASKILLVDDEPSVRSSMSLVLAKFGYIVQLAEDGFSALRDIRQDMPDILISDLNMPGMSGFELLSVVRRRFPALRTIAMSGTCSGSDVTPGLTADAFYSKGSGVKALLGTLQTLTNAKHCLTKASSDMTQLLIHRGDTDSSPDACVTITCPECLRTFPQGISGSVDRIHATKCLHCLSPIHFAIAPSVDRPPLPTPNKIPVKREPRPRSGAQYYY